MPVLPKEHGAWALLYGPFLLTMAALGRFEVRVLAFFLTFTALFLAHEPLSKLVRSARHGAPRSQLIYWKRWLAVYLGVALTAGLYLLWQYRLWDLVPLGLLIITLLLLHLYLIRERREKAVWGELLGVVGLSATAPATYYVMEGRWDETCILLWFLSFLYFTSGIFYVKMKVSRFIKSAGPRNRVRHCIVYHVFLFVTLLLLSWSGFISPLLILAYVPIITRAFVGVSAREERLNIRKIGYTELAHTCLFLALFTLLWHL